MSRAQGIVESCKCWMRNLPAEKGSKYMQSVRAGSKGYWSGGTEVPPPLRNNLCLFTAKSRQGAHQVRRAVNLRSSGKLRLKGKVLLVNLKQSHLRI